MSLGCDAGVALNAAPSLQFRFGRLTKSLGTSASLSRCSKRTIAGNCSIASEGGSGKCAAWPAADSTGDGSCWVNIAGLKRNHTYRACCHSYGDHLVAGQNYSTRGIWHLDSFHLARACRRGFGAQVGQELYRALRAGQAAEVEEWLQQTPLREGKQAQRDSQCVKKVAQQGWGLDWRVRLGSIWKRDEGWAATCWPCV